MVDPELLAGRDVSENGLSAVGPLDPEFVHLGSHPQPKVLHAGILRYKVAADRNFAHLRGRPHGRMDPRTGRPGVRRSPFELHGQVIAGSAVIAPVGQGLLTVEMELEDVDIAVVVEIGADDAAPLLGIREAELRRPLNEGAVAAA